MYKKVLALAMTVVLLLLAAPAVFADDLMEDADYYAKQDGTTICTLASAAMMLRRRAYLDGFADWTEVTESAVRGTAWSNGLAHSFTYRGMTVGYASLSGSAAEKEQQLIALLSEHPEGIAVYDRSSPHAILLTDYTDGTFYCADPAAGTAGGRITAAGASISLSRVSGYWYVAADANPQLDAAPVESIALLGVYYPENVSLGGTFDLGGIVKCSPDAVIEKVTVEILAADGTAVQSVTVKPDTAGSEWEIRSVNRQVTFNTLAAGSYQLHIYAQDTAGDTLDFTRGFTVSGAAQSTLYYWSESLTAAA